MTSENLSTSAAGNLSPAHRSALILMTAGLLGILALHLLLALLAGLAAFVLHRRLVVSLQRWFTPRSAHTLALLLMLLAFAAGLAAVVEGLTELSAASASGGLPRLMQLMAETLNQLRASAPAWLASRLPASAAALHDMVAQWLQAHAAQVQLWSSHTLRGLAYVLAGLVVGFLASATGAALPAAASPLMLAWRDRLQQLAQAFSDVVAAQLRIAAINTILTAIFLLLVLPLLGQDVPLASTLVALTFFASLLPIIGNLISNTAIVLVSLTVSPWLGLVSLGFLIGVHKFEYFLNAHIVGTRIRAHTYELLAAMLVMEAAFGLAGLVAAPIYYAWMTREMRTYGFA